jgi:hypothetical protein
MVAFTYKEFTNNSTSWMLYFLDAGFDNQLSSSSYCPSNIRG